MLTQATVNNAELIAMCNSRNPNKEASLGVIEDGAWADLIIYSNNPLKDINVVVDYESHLKFIMKDGTGAGSRQSAQAMRAHLRCRHRLPVPILVA